MAWCYNHDGHHGMEANSKVVQEETMDLVQCKGAQRRPKRHPGQRQAQMLGAYFAATLSQRGVGWRSGGGLS
eukprot:4414216-Amphidinium_carterae.1